VDLAAGTAKLHWRKEVLNAPSLYVHQHELHTRLLPQLPPLLLLPPLLPPPLLLLLLATHQM
jgi:hypothetical protein